MFPNRKTSMLAHYSMFSSKKCSFPPATLSTPDVMLRCHYLQAILQVTHSSFVKTKIKLKQLHCSFVTLCDSHRAHPQDTAFLSGDLIYVAPPLSSTNFLVEMMLVIFPKNNAKLYQTKSKNN